MAGGSFTLDVGTYNTWHGLDHTRPSIMFPLEKRVARAERRVRFLDGLERLMARTNDRFSLLALQEVNPLDRRSAEIKTRLSGCELRTMEANVGVRIGRLSYPFFLQEGLCTLWNQPVSGLQVYRWTLSGAAPDYDIPFWKWPLTLQTAERRSALGTFFVAGGLRFLIVNLHLHHGPADEGADRRRIEELSVMFERMKPLENRVDATLVIGDFNFELGQPDHTLLLEQGFREISLNATGGPVVTWDPVNNPLCESNAAMGGGSAWDQAPRQFDHLFLRTTRAFRSSPARRLFDGSDDLPISSDHYGLVNTLEFET